MFHFLFAIALTGVVVDPGGAPVAGARVVVRSSSLVQAGAATSSADGRFSLDDLAAGSYLIRAEKRGFEAVEQAVRLGEASGGPLTLRLGLSPVRSEVTVSAEAGEAMTREETPQRVSLIGGDFLWEQARKTLIEAAAGVPGVVEQRTAPAMGSFMVRGMTGKGVGVYRDGIRLTTSVQRGGVSTFQNLAEAAGLESIEVLRGPNSAQYGSDALGGVVHLISRTPVLGGGPRLTGHLSLFGDTASNGFGGQSVGSYGSERMGLVSTLAARRLNTLRSASGLDSHAAVTRFLGLPADVLGDRLPDTAFTQYGGSLHGQFRLAAATHLVAHYDRSQQDGAKRYDQLAGGDGNLIADLRNLMADFGYLRLEQFSAGPFERLSVSGSYSAQREERVNQGGQGNPAGSVTHQYERLAMWGLQAQAERRGAQGATMIGAEGYRERVAAPAFAANPVSGAVTLTRPRVPHGARYLNYGLFVQQSWEPERARRIRFSGALRYGGASYQSRASFSPLVGGRPLWPDDSLSANAFSGRAGSTFRAAETVWLHVNYARGLRAPNVTDLGTLGIQGNGNYEASASALAGLNATIGDRADDRAVSTGSPVERLRPETDDNIDYGIAWRGGRVRAELGGFYSRLGNSIVSQTLILPAGAVGMALGDQIVSRQLASGAVYVPAATNPVLARANYGGARLKGVEQSVRVRLTNSLTVNQNWTWIEARDATTGVAPDIEPGIPAPSGRASALYAPQKRRVWIEAYVDAASRQSRLSSLALSDRRTGAPRSTSNIASFFNNGARVRGLVSNGILIPTGETLAQVQRRVLGGASSAPMWTAIPGYAIAGLRVGMPAGAHTDVMADFSNLADHAYRGIGWGVEGAGRAVTVQLRFRL